MTHIRITGNEEYQVYHDKENNIMSGYFMTSYGIKVKYPKAITKITS